MTNEIRVLSAVEIDQQIHGWIPLNLAKLPLLPTLISQINASVAAEPDILNAGLVHNLDSVFRALIVSANVDQHSEDSFIHITSSINLATELAWCDPKNTTYERWWGYYDALQMLLGQFANIEKHPRYQWCKSIANVIASNPTDSIDAFAARLNFYKEKLLQGIHTLKQFNLVSETVGANTNGRFQLTAKGWAWLSSLQND